MSNNNNNNHAGNRNSSKPKGQSLNHLINFHSYENRPRHVEQDLQHLRLLSLGRASQYRTSSYSQPFDKKKYLSANFRFVIDPIIVRSAEDPLRLAERWANVAAVVVFKEGSIQCPICLDVVRVPRITSCGHVYCLVCMLAHAFSCEANTLPRCPICFADCDMTDLRPAMIKTAEEPMKGSLVQLNLVACGKKDLVPLLVDQGTANAECFRGLPLCESVVGKFSRVVVGTQQFLSERVQSDMTQLEECAAEAYSDGDQIRMMLIPEAQNQLSERASYWSSRAALIFPQECASPSTDTILNRSLPTHAFTSRPSHTSTKTGLASTKIDPASMKTDPASTKIDQVDTASAVGVSTGAGTDVGINVEAATDAWYDVAASSGVDGACAPPPIPPASIVFSPSVGSVTQQLDSADVLQMDKTDQTDMVGDSDTETTTVAHAAAKGGLSAGASAFVPKIQTTSSATATVPSQVGGNSDAKSNANSSISSVSNNSSNNNTTTTTNNNNNNSNDNNNIVNNNSKNNCSKNKNKNNDRKRGGGGGGASQGRRGKGKAYTPTSKSVFYQSATGQYIYLHPFNVKCLLHQYGRVQDFPAKIYGKVLETVQEVITPAFLKRHAYLSHLPPMAAIKQVEIDFASATTSTSTTTNGKDDHVLSAKTLSLFRAEIKRRKQKRIADEDIRNGSNKNSSNNGDKSNMNRKSPQANNSSKNSSKNKSIINKKGSTNALAALADAGPIYTSGDGAGAIDIEDSKALEMAIQASLAMNHYPKLCLTNAAPADFTLTSSSEYEIGTSPNQFASLPSATLRAQKSSGATSTSSSTSSEPIWEARSLLAAKGPSLEGPSLAAAYGSNRTTNSNSHNRGGPVLEVVGNGTQESGNCSWGRTATTQPTSASNGVSWTQRTGGGNGYNFHSQSGRNGTISHSSANKLSSGVELNKCVSGYTGSGSEDDDDMESGVSSSPAQQWTLGGILLEKLGEERSAGVNSGKKKKGGGGGGGNKRRNLLSNSSHRTYNR